VQSRFSSVSIAIGLVAVIIASVVVLLLVSIDREFVPGIVELSVALGLAGLFGVAMLFGLGPRNALEQRLKNVRTGEILFATAAAGLLALTAGLAAAEENFPWPVPLIGVVLLAAAALRNTRDGAQTR